MVASIASIESRAENREVWLDCAPGAWWIAAGSVDIFAVEAMSGLRHFIFRASTGEQMFTLPTVSSRIRVLARPSPDAILERAPAAGSSSRELEAWINRFASIVQPGVERTASFSSVMHRLEALIDERQGKEQARLRRKAAAGEADLDSAMSALADPRRTPDVIRHAAGPSNPLFRACQAATEAAGITLVCPDFLSGDGGTVEGIARASAVRVRRLQLRGTWWKRDAGPLLGYREGHPVALIPTKSERYLVYDPASGAREHVDELIAAQIEPEAYIFYAAMPSGEIGLLRLVRFGLRGSHADLIRAVACIAATGLLGLVTPILTAWFAGTVIPSGDRGQLVVLTGALVISAICSALFSLTSSLALQRTGIRAGARTMAAVWDRVLRLPASFFRHVNPADLALRVLSIDRAREALAGTLLAGALTFLFSALNVVLLFHFAPALAVPAIVIVMAIAAIAALCGWLTLQRHSAIAAWEAHTAGKALESIQGIAKFRVAGAEHRAFASWARSFAQGRREHIRSRGISGALTAIQAAAPLSAWILVAGFTDSASPGDSATLLAFGVAFQQLLGGAVQLSGLLLAWAQIAALVNRTKTIMTAEPESNRDGIDPGPLSGKLELRDLTFRYDPAGPAVLDGISLSIEPGEFVALVGSSGSGKSTLLRLLLGFERPDAGSILYDNRELSTLNLPSVRRQLGVVLQGGHILTGDIASNILAATGLGLEAAWRAAESAGIACDIRSMPMGMHTQLSEDGTGLSGGQRQRLLIARALVHNPRLLLLDEATSALDSRTQAVVTSGLEQLGVTRIVIAHRLSTVRHADRICVLEGGRIVEIGSYTELMDRKGRFAALAARQSA